VCCALLIGGALFLAARRAPSPAAGPAVTSSPVLAIERAPVQATPKAEAPLFAAPAVAAEQPREVSVGETVDGHLAAGEFGPALDAALTADDARERTQLIRRVITAQLPAAFPTPTSGSPSAAAVHRKPLWAAGWAPTSTR
jgi:hypothetical protein